MGFICHQKITGLTHFWGLYLQLLKGRDSIYLQHLKGRDCLYLQPLPFLRLYDNVPCFIKVFYHDMRSMIIIVNFWLIRSYFADKGSEGTSSQAPVSKYKVLHFMTWCKTWTKLYPINKSIFCFWNQMFISISSKKKSTGGTILHKNILGSLIPQFLPLWRPWPCTGGSVPPLKVKLWTNLWKMTLWCVFPKTRW